jgi:hypothetical protein
VCDFFFSLIKILYILYNIAINLFLSKLESKKKKGGIKKIMDNLLTNPNNYVYLPPPPLPTGSSSPSSPTPNVWFGGKDINKIRKFITNSLSATVPDDHKPSSEGRGGINEASIKCLVLAFLRNNRYYREKFEVISEFQLGPSIYDTTYVDLVLKPKNNSMLSDQPQQHVLIELKNISLMYLRTETLNQPKEDDKNFYRNPYWGTLRDKWQLHSHDVTQIAYPKWRMEYRKYNKKKRFWDDVEESIEENIVSATVQLDGYINEYKTKTPSVVCHGLLLMVIGGVPFFYWKEGTKATTTIISPILSIRPHFSQNTPRTTNNSSPFTPVPSLVSKTPSPSFSLYPSDLIGAMNNLNLGNALNQDNLKNKKPQPALSPTSVKLKDIEQTMRNNPGRFISAPTTKIIKPESEEEEEQDTDEEEDREEGDSYKVALNPGDSGYSSSSSD